MFFAVRAQDHEDAPGVYPETAILRRYLGGLEYFLLQQQ